MSKKRQRAQTGAPAPQAAPGQGASGLKKRGLLMIGGVVLIAGVVIGRVAYNRAGSHLVFPAPGPPEADTAVSQADFVGAEACASCHASEYAAWKRSTHGVAGGPPSPERVKGPFDGRPLRFRDAVVTPSVT